MDEMPEAKPGGAPPATAPPPPQGHATAKKKPATKDKKPRHMDPPFDDLYLREYLNVPGCNEQTVSDAKPGAAPSPAEHAPKGGQQARPSRNPPIPKLSIWLRLDNFLQMARFTIQYHHSFINTPAYKTKHPSSRDPVIQVPDDGGEDSDDCHDDRRLNQRRKKHKLRVPPERKLSDPLPYKNPNETFYLRLARYYGRQFHLLSLKNCIRVARRLKRMFCKQCFVVWIPKVSCLTRVKQWKGLQRVVYRCVECNWKRRFPINDDDR